MSTVTIWEAAGANGGAKASLEQLIQLVKQGESINQPNWAGCTPLHCAAPEGNTAILKFLLDSGADVNKTTPYGLTPLHFACYYGRLENVELLLAHGAHITARTYDGHSPKDKAVEGQKGGRAKGADHRFAEVIELLAECEANPQRVYSLRKPATAPAPAPAAPPPALPTPTPAAPLVTQPAAINMPALGPDAVDAQLQSFLDHLDKMLKTHRQSVLTLTGPAKEEGFQRMLRDVVRLAAAFEKPAGTPQPTPVAAPAASASAPTWTSPNALTQPEVLAAAKTQTSATYLAKPQWNTEVPAPPVTAAPMAAAAKPGAAAASADGKLVLYDSPAPDPTTDYYTQQYQRYLEHVKSGARNNAVYSGDYFTSGAQSARTVFPGQTPYSQFAPAAPPRTPQPAWPSYSTAYQPPQHPAYGMAFTAPTFSYNPFGQVGQRW